MDKTKLAEMLYRYVEDRPGRRLPRELGLPSSLSTDWVALVDAVVERDRVLALLRKAQAGCDPEGEGGFRALRRERTQRLLASGRLLARSRELWSGEIAEFEEALTEFTDRHELPLSPSAAVELDDMEVTFVGQFSSGKSSLINAWLGEPGLLPTSNNVTTPCETRIRRVRDEDGECAGMTVMLASEAELRTRLSRWLSEEYPDQETQVALLPWPKVADWVTRLEQDRTLHRPSLGHWKRVALAAVRCGSQLWSGTEPSWTEGLDADAGGRPVWTPDAPLVLNISTSTLQKIRVSEDSEWTALITQIEVRLNDQSLPAGVVFVDSPGAGSHDPTHVQRAIELLGRAHAAVFVASFDRPESESLLQLVQAFVRTRQTDVPVVVALNKSDQADSGDELEKTIARVSEELASYGLDATPCPVSAQAVVHELDGGGADVAIDVDALVQRFVTFQKAVENLLVDAETAHARRRAREQTIDRVRSLRAHIESTINLLRKSHKQEKDLAVILTAVEDTLGRWEPSLQTQVDTQSTKAETAELSARIGGALVAHLQHYKLMSEPLPNYMRPVVAGVAADAALAWHRTNIQRAWDDASFRHSAAVGEAHTALQGVLAPLKSVGYRFELESIRLALPGWATVERRVLPTLEEFERLSEEVVAERWLRLAHTTMGRSGLLKELSQELALRLGVDSLAVAERTSAALAPCDQRAARALAELAEMMKARVAATREHVGEKREKAHSSLMRMRDARSELGTLSARISGKWSESLGSA